MDVQPHPEAERELRDLRQRSVSEHVAMLRVIEKLEVMGLDLGYPHCSQVEGTRLRELRPRAGSSPWRALYSRVGDAFIIWAIAPEAKHDRRGFRAAIDRAESRREADS